MNGCRLFVVQCVFNEIRGILVTTPRGSGCDVRTTTTTTTTTTQHEGGAVCASVCLSISKHLRVACTSIKYTVDTAHICRCSQNGGEREASLGSSTVSVLSVIVNRPIYPSIPRSRLFRTSLSLSLRSDEM